MDRLLHSSYHFKRLVSIFPQENFISRLGQNRGAKIANKPLVIDEQNRLRATECWVCEWEWVSIRSGQGNRPLLRRIFRRIRTEDPTQPVYHSNLIYARQQASCRS